MISDETRAYYDLKKRNDARGSAKRLRRQFLRYKDAEIVYSFQHRKLLELASEAGAIYRMVGAVFVSGSCFAVYNTRGTAMKWSGMGEFKALHSLLEVGRLNTCMTAVDAALLFGESGSVALRTLLESDKSRRLEFHFDSILYWK